MSMAKKSSRNIFYVLIFLWYTLSSFAIAGTPTHWHLLKPGLQFTTLNNKQVGKIIAFRIDLKNYRFKLAKSARGVDSIEQFVKKNNALIGVNGGFFTPAMQPLGLRISDGKKISKIKPISWWGVFYTDHHRAHIVTYKNFHPRGVRFAIQTGPRLVVNGYIPKLRPGIDDRTAIGIDSAGRVILLVTDNSPMSTRQLAAIMRKPLSKGGLGCRNALNLDGGSSTQLYAKVSGMKLNVPSFTPVVDAVLVLND